MSPCGVKWHWGIRGRGHMRAYQLFPAVLILLSCGRTGHAAATEEIGPDKDRSHPTVEQPGWPAGMVEIVRHDSRVYSIWVNGNEDFYFQATPGHIGELIKLYSQTRLRDHVVCVKKAKDKVTTFQRDEIGYNVNLHYLGGIALAMTRRDGGAETYEPTLTILVDAGAPQNLSQQITIPDNFVVSSDVAGWEGKVRGTVPKRVLWHAAVVFDDGKPAADFENGVSTKVTLWETDAETGFDLGSVSHIGQFTAAFSDEEIASLKAGRMWLTLTAGNPMTAPAKGDTKLPIDQMSMDPSQVKTVKVAKPGIYLGRLLFEDGSPAVLDPPPWPGAEISLTFPFAGRITVDEQGYCKVFLTPGQFEEAKAQPVRKNVYVPDVEKKGRSTARYAFPAAKLSLDKDKAGEMRIPRPRAQKKQE
jgi:hypothetical protein